MSDAVRYRREPLTPGLEAELESLVRDYYARTPAHDGLPPYEFRWEVYRHARSTTLVTARSVQSAALLGFALYLHYDHPHHNGFRLADCDTLAVSPEARGRGIGRGLMAYAEPLLKDRGARRIIHRHRLVYGDNALFPKLGYRPEEVAFFKDI